MAWGSRRGQALVLVLVLGLGLGSLAAVPAEARRRRPPAGTALTAAALGWRATTRSLRAQGVANVYRVPGRSDRWGKLASGTRVAWKRVIAGRGACRVWVEIEPRGWVCSRALAPSDEPPLAIPAIDPAAILARVLAAPFLAIAPAGAATFATVRDASRQRRGTRLGGWTFLRLPLATRDIGGQPFHRTRHGCARPRRCRARPRPLPASTSSPRRHPRGPSRGSRRAAPSRSWSAPHRASRPRG